MSSTASADQADTQSPNPQLVETRETEQLHIFCDLDGVLCDFEASALPLCKAKRMPNENRLWACIGRHGVRGFFSSLDWMDGARSLWRYLHQLRCDGNVVQVLTGLPCGELTQGARRGKEEWCAKQLGADVHVITCMSRDKHRFCRGANYVLIDDRESLGKDWERAGGTFIHHVEAEKSIEVLQMMLSSRSRVPRLLP
jgi:hypothetical protein